MNNVSKLLLELGVDITSCGGRCLQYCITRCCEDPELLNGMTSGIYAEAGRACGSTEHGGERAMRWELSNAASRRDWTERVYDFETAHDAPKLIDNTVSDKTAVPSLGRFIRAIVYVAQGNAR